MEGHSSSRNPLPFFQRQASISHQSPNVAPLRPRPHSKAVSQIPQPGLPAALRPGYQPESEDRASNEGYDQRSRWYHRPGRTSERETSLEDVEQWRLRQHPKPPRLHQKRHRVAPPPINASLLYPPMGPYDDGRGASSAPEHLEHFRSSSSVSAPVVPDAMPFPGREDNSPTMGIPRSPTYPPASIRRIRSARQMGDATFDDDAEFRLFVEATAGLSPDRTDWQLGTEGSSRPWTPRRQSQGRASERDWSHSIDHPSSTYVETPTTLQALQQMAQLPESSQSSSTDHRWREELARSTSGLDHRSHISSGRNITAMEEESDDSDCELPNYEQSQAEAHARQTARAASRAMELQRRWEQSGSRRQS